MVYLILAIPVPQKHEQIVAAQGVHFAKVMTTIDAMVTLFKAGMRFLTASEVGGEEGAVVRL